MGVRRGAARRAVPHEQRQQNVGPLPAKCFFFFFFFFLTNFFFFFFFVLRNVFCSGRLPAKCFLFWRQKSKNSFEHIIFYKTSDESNPGKNTSKGIESR